MIDESSQFVLLHAAQPVTTVPLRMLEAPDIRGYRKGSDGNLPLTDGDERPSPASRAVAHEVPYLSVADLTAVGQIGLGFATAWTLPERYWNGLTRAIARARLRAQPGWAAAQRRYLRRWVGEGDIGMSFDALLEAYLANRRVSKLQAFRCRHPAGWNPRTALEGRAFLDEALARGRGAILWVAPFVFGPLLTKMALHRAGHTCSHLSRYSHGFSQSRLGAQLLNPVRADVEERFLAERVVIGPDGSVHAAMRRLTARLRANGVVSVNVGAHGTRPMEVLFMNGPMLLASGVFGLARQTSAPLLPVFTAREGDGSYVARIAAPLVPLPGVEREAAALELAQRFARQLETEVRRYPDQFWWHYDVLQLTGPQQDSTHGPSA